MHHLQLCGEVNDSQSHHQRCCHGDPPFSRWLEACIFWCFIGEAVKTQWGSLLSDHKPAYILLPCLCVCTCEDSEKGYQTDKTVLLTVTESKDLHSVFLCALLRTFSCFLSSLWFQGHRINIMAHSVFKQSSVKGERSLNWLRGIGMQVEVGKGMRIGCGGTKHLFLRGKSSESFPWEKVEALKLC